MTPLHKAHKRGTSSSDWQKAYQAVKHDRALNLHSANIGNLLKAMGALYILNIYYRNAEFKEVADSNGSSIDWSLGSELFTVKVSPERNGVSSDGQYSKKPDYDECIYLIKHTDKTVKVVADLMQQMNKEVSDQALNAVTQSVTNIVKAGKIKDQDELSAKIRASYEEQRKAASDRFLSKKKFEFRDAFMGLKYEAVLNKNQF